MKLFRSPWYTDWSIWLGIAGVLWGVNRLLNTLSRTTVTNKVGALTAIFLAVAFYWTIFAIVPAGIRYTVKWLRMTPGTDRSGAPELEAPVEASSDPARRRET